MRRGRYTGNTAEADSKLDTEAAKRLLRVRGLEVGSG